MNVKYDWNEWYFLISSVAALLTFWPIRKYFRPVIVLLIWMYNIFLVSSIDYFLIATPFKAYYFGDNPTYELSGALFHLFMYPCASLVFLYFYDKFELRGKKTVVYILGWTGFSVFYEWICVKNNALIYTGWKLLYSIPVYPVAAFLLILFFHFIRNKYQDLAY
ncbi:hypothetical protein M3172_19170 [Mesobacillus subterraneus]|uniref:hypothetical protein n=1 Tax=Mesobacillus subterraneus TaxID=285983 RepID=UPI00203E80D7|nr:hypothetical protein [Mesobacillus subterraneus]MCM3575324.1 hypothetical protein [Mesobacillus subterraneus]